MAFFDGWSEEKQQLGNTGELTGADPTLLALAWILIIIIGVGILIFLVSSIRKYNKSHTALLNHLESKSYWRLTKVLYWATVFIASMFLLSSGVGIIILIISYFGYILTRQVIIYISGIK